ncbi:MAG: ABC-F family ATP-binding cassette domain-containing protein [Chitinophagales bacterium]
MISISNISVSFSGIDLFKQLSFVVNPRDRIGLIGKNGVGKSTLLKIIAGTQAADSGSVDVPESNSIGYLPQELKMTSTKSILEETKTAFQDVLDMEAEIAKITSAIEERTDYESDEYGDLINRLSELHHQLELKGGSKMDSEIEKILKGLGFKESEFLKPIQEFSGGWQMRVELAKLLLRTPDLLLLDEPTNHLDIESILWLEEFFINYQGAIIMVSHDRMFLDNVTNRTIELVFGSMYDFKVPYSKYMELREERYEQQIATYRNQQKYIEQQQKFIDRFRAQATKAKQVQSKVKLLEKMDQVNIDELDEQQIDFRFPPAPRSGDISLEVKKLVKSYGEKKVFSDANFILERGDKVAFVGKNGMGKSTMVRLINQLEKPDSGSIKIGHNIKIGYYAQVQENVLNEEKSVLATIEDEATGDWSNISRIRALLGAFLFDENDVEKKVKVLSGGEKSRLALARLLLTPVNMLILDEPTNHLDISAKDMLKQAVNKFEGTLIVVSHDRDFLDGLTDKTYEFVDGRVKEHLGPVQDFLNAHQAEHFRAFEQTDNKKAAGHKPNANKNPKANNNRKEIERTIKQISHKVEKTELKIESQESELKVLEKKMADPEVYSDVARLEELNTEYQKKKSSLEALMQEWESLQKQQEKAEAEMQ